MRCAGWLTRCRPSTRLRSPLCGACGASTGSVIDKAMGDETGWKLVSGDVFRRPGHIVLYSALVGVGSHLFLLSVLVIAASLAGSLHVDRGAVLKAAVFGYSVTSVASGFFSGAFSSFGAATAFGGFTPRGLTSEYPLPVFSLMSFSISF